MSRQAGARAADYDLDHYGERLRATLARARDFKEAGELQSAVPP